MTDRTKVTEIATGLGTIAAYELNTTLPMTPPEIRGVDETTWARFCELAEQPKFAATAITAFENGRALLAAQDGLRGRSPRVVEWHGPHGSPGDEVAPIDLRVDHVYLVSCKYLSRILANPSPSHLFRRLLLGRQGVRSANWFDEVARDEHHALFEAVRPHLSGPSSSKSLDARSRAERRQIAQDLQGDWPTGCEELYQRMVRVVAERSAALWRSQLTTTSLEESMLWRLLRIGSAPYFVLGADGTTPLRLRVASPWDWRQHFSFRSLEIEARAGGQALVAWRANYRSTSGVDESVDGHVEIRWSHGRFSGPPEAKV
ncbi:MAG TPA: hypothetical protein VJM33_04965, partial [Microthrixaceae bacterium]|nr:hypothetical protein [Microthrixaceae bacterium]